MYLVFSLLLLSSCSFLSVDKNIPVNSWSYQLQDLNPEKTSTYSDVGMVVTDYSLDGSIDKRFNPLSLDRLFGKIPFKISYFSIGEAENYRWYFRKLPKDLILEENPKWRGNFTVKYWDKRWRDILLYQKGSYLEQIQNAGFDGVYLDIVDAFKNFENKRKRANQMAGLIVEIKKEGLKRNPNFKVLIQNALDILDYLDAPENFLTHIDGVGIESLFFLGDSWENNPFNPQTDWFPLMKRYEKAGVSLFCVEYISEPKKIARFFKEAQKFGCIPLATDKDLSGKWFYKNLKY